VVVSAVDNTPLVCVAEREEPGELMDVQAAALLDGERAAWVVPEPRERLRVCQARLGLLVVHVLVRGHVDLTSDGHAVAIRYRYDRFSIAQTADCRRRLAAVTGPWLPEFRAVDRATQVLHRDWPAHHLAHLAVLPGWQSHGNGGLLLAHHDVVLTEMGHRRAAVTVAANRTSSRRSAGSGEQH
jgi:hypothetical protein